MYLGRSIIVKCALILDCEKKMLSLNACEMYVRPSRFYKVLTVL